MDRICNTTIKLIYHVTPSTSATYHGRRGKGTRLPRQFQTDGQCQTDVIKAIWTYVDDASNDNGSRAGMLLIFPERHKIHCVIRFGFKASNNEAEYKDLITGLCLSRERQAHTVKIFSDSELLVSQMNDIYLARREKMTAYLEKAKEQLSSFSVASIEII